MNPIDATLLEALLAGPVGVAVLDRELRYTHFNRALAAMNGSDPEAFIGRTLREVVPHLADRLEPALHQVMQSRTALRDLELEGSGPDEGRCWLEHLQPLTTENGEVAGVVVIVEEITERRRQVRDEEAALRARLDAIPNHAWITGGPNGQVVWYNRRWHDYTGISAEDARRDGGSSVAHPEDRAALQAAYAEGMRQQQAFEAEARLRSRDGHYRAFSVRAEPIFEDGKLAGWVGTNTDIQASRESTERLRELLTAAKRATERSSLAERAANGFIYDWEPHGNSVNRSENFSRVMGYDPAELPEHAEAWGSLIHPDDLDQTRRAEAMIATGQPETKLEYRVLHRDGQYRWVLDQARILRDSQGQVQRVVGITTDITERKHAEAQLAEREALSRLALEVANLGTWRWWLGSQRVEADARTREIVGLESLPQLNFDLVFERIHPSDRESVRAMLNTAVEPGSAGTFAQTLRFVHPDGTERWIAARGRTQFDAATGRPESMLGTVQDITEATRARARLEASESALRDSQGQLGQAMNAARMFDWQLDPTTGRFAPGENFAAVIGLSRPVSSANLLDYLHPEDTERVMAGIRRLVEEPSSFDNEFRLLHPESGEEIWLSAQGVTVHRTDRRPLLSGVAQNVTRRKRAELALTESEARLQQINETQRRFISDAAHELRAPLTSIRGNLELLLRHTEISPEEHLEMLGDAAREAARLSRLVSDLLAMARGDAGSHNELVPLRFDRLLEEALRGARHLVQGRHLEATAFPQTTVNGDSDRLKQLVLVLVENALKYTQSGGVVSVSLRLSPGWAELRVTDNGPGIAPEDLERVFERFYRADRARTPGRDPGGTGLGLPIARMIAHSHGGTVQLESHWGQGTTAIVRLPLETAPAQVPQPLGEPS